MVEYFRKRIDRVTTNTHCSNQKTFPIEECFLIITTHF